MQNNLCYNPGCSLCCESYALQHDAQTKGVALLSFQDVQKKIGLKFEEKGVLCCFFHLLENC